MFNIINKINRSIVCRPCPSLFLSATSTYSFISQLSTEHSEENYSVLYDNLALPEVYAKEHKQSDTEENSEEPVNYDNVAIPEINVKKDKK